MKTSIRSGSGAGRSAWPALIGVLAVPAIVLAQTAGRHGDANFICKVCHSADPGVCAETPCSSNQACGRQQGRDRDGNAVVRPRCINENEIVWE